MPRPSKRLLPALLLLLCVSSDGWSAVVQIISHRGGRIDWSPQNLIAFDRRDGNGFYNIYTMKPDGTDLRCRTCERDTLGLPHRNVGQPAWHPSGRYIVFQAEKDRHVPTSFYFTSPSVGVYNDLWILNLESNKAMPLTNLPNSKEFGTLDPHFSRDGRRLSWSEMYRSARMFNRSQRFGYFKLKVADFESGRERPRLSDEKAYQPDAEGYYDNDGFSPDGSQLIFSHNGGGASPFKNNIYTMELHSGHLAQTLTDSSYNEHAHYSPDGKRVVWVTNQDNDNEGTDYWMMNADGSHKIRLTCFNHPGCPEHTGEKMTVSDLSWSPHGKEIVGYVQVGGINNPEDGKGFEERDIVVRIPD